MKHVNNLTGNSKDLDVIVKGKITGMSISTEDKVLYKIETDEFDKFEADECCVYHDVTKPVVVKQFVADWYEEHKEDFEGSLFRCINCILSLYEEGELNDFEEWVVDSRTKPFQTLVNMHQFGYEVEKEKRYRVKLKGINSESEYLYYGNGSRTWRFMGKNESGYFRRNHTRKQLEESGFGEVFNSKMFEVKEVEE